jgi:hypothetical protein
VGQHAEAHRRRVTEPVSSRRVAVILTVSAEADATLEALRLDDAPVTISDHSTYYVIEGQDRLSIDLDRVALELGEPLSMGRWLGALSGYVGRVCPDERHFIVTADALPVEPE